MYDNYYSYDKPLAPTPSPVAPMPPGMTPEATVPAHPVTSPRLRYRPPTPPAATDIPPYVVDDPR